MKKCFETNLVLNWQKCHFMVTKGIILGHKISARGIEVEEEIIEVIERIPPPRDTKAVISFLRHVRFYKRFMRDFSKIPKPLRKLLAKMSSSILIVTV